jgi:hypothetical protein
MWNKDRNKRRQPTTSASAILCLLVMVVASVSGAAALAGSAHPSTPAGNTAFSSATIGITAGASSNACSGVTTCLHTVTTTAFSTVLIGITVYSTTAPSAVAIGHASYTPTDVVNSAATAPVSYIYAFNDAAAITNLAVYVNFSATTYYVMNLADITNTAVASGSQVFYAGSNTEYGASTVATCLPSTTYTGELVYGLIGVETTAESSITPGTGMTVVGSSTATTSSVVTQEAQQGTDTATGEYTVSATLASSGTWRTDCAAFVATTAPSAPTSLASGVITATTVPLTWSLAASQSAYVTGATVFWASYSGSCGSFGSSGSASNPYTSYTVTGLTAGNYYCFYVTDTNTTGTSIPSAILSDVQTSAPPNAPTTLVAAPQPGSNTQINLKWAAPAGGTQTSYTLDQYSPSSVCGGGASATTGIDPTALSYLVTGLTAGTVYSYALIAVNANGNSVASNCATTTTFATPSAPTGLSYTGETAYQISIAWINPTGANLYNDTVFYQTSACSGAYTATSVGVADAATITGLTPYTLYCFYVMAWSGGAHSADSSSLSITTFAGLPAAPSNFQESAVSATTVTFTWTNPTATTGSYINVTAYFGASCGAIVTGAAGTHGTWTYNVNLNGSIVSTYIFAGLASSTSYCFSVALWTQGGQGPQATTVTYSTTAPVPSAPTILTFVSSSHSAVTLNWSQPSGVILSDSVSYTTVAACASGLVTVNLAGPTTTATIGSLSSSTTYYWEVYATNSGGNSPYSSCVTGATQGATPPAPYGLAQQTVGASFASLTWINPAGYSLTDNIVYVYTYSSGCTVSQIAGSPFDQSGVVTYYEVTGLTPGTTYCIKVTAVDTESPQSAPLVVTTSNGSSVPPVSLAPAGITYVEIGALALVGVVVLAVILGGGDKRKRKRARS